MTCAHPAHKKSGARFLADARGAAGVEFAFVLPALLIGAFLIVEFGRIMYAKVEFDYAVFGATRFSAVSKDTTTSKIKTALTNNLILLDPAKISNVTLTTASNGDATTTATLSASYRVDTLLPMTNLTTMTLTRSVSFLVNK